MESVGHWSKWAIPAAAGAAVIAYSWMAHAKSTAAASASTSSAAPAPEATAAASATSGAASGAAGGGGEGVAHGAVFRPKSDVSMPTTSDGRTMHLQFKKGEVANRILSVGDHDRARRIAAHFDGGKFIEVPSTRGFRTFTGRFNGVPVSIVATGMGISMMDFVVREARVVVDGTLAIVRLGSCGGLAETPAGCLAVASKGSVLIRRDPDADHEPFPDPRPAPPTDAAGLRASRPDRPYVISRCVPADAELSRLYAEALRECVAGHEEAKDARVVEGIGASADSFFSSQGREPHGFDDRNDRLLDELMTLYPELVSLEMEHFQLLDLGQASRGSVRTSAAAITAVNRATGDWVKPEVFSALESLGGRGALLALTRLPIADAMPESELPRP